jgi:hypothetical protein
MKCCKTFLKFWFKTRLIVTHIQFNYTKKPALSYEYFRKMAILWIIIIVIVIIIIVVITVYTLQFSFYLLHFVAFPFFLLMPTL